MRKYIKSKKNIILISISLLLIVFFIEDTTNNASHNEINILTYHHLLPKDREHFKENSSVIDVEVFEEQMKFLYENDYNAVTLQELEKFLLGEIELPEKSIVITFDDGYLSNYKYAYPILKKYNLKASIFLITSLIERKPQEFNESILQYLSEKELQEMSDVFEYANHTNNLHRLNDENISFLLLESKEKIKQDLETNIYLTKSHYFAYPYGQYNEEIISLLEDVNMTMAFTTKSGPVKKDDSMLELNRYSIYPGTDLETFKTITGHERL